MSEKKLTDQELRWVRDMLAQRYGLAPVPPAPKGSPRAILDKKAKEKRDGS